MVKLITTKIQDEAIEFEAEHILIKGAPGSGKTTVLLLKAMKLLIKEPNAKLLLVTYNKTLTKYVKDFFEEKKVDTKNITITTFHSWAWKVLRKLDRKAPNSDSKKISEVFNETYSDRKKTATHRFYQEEDYKNFLKEEIAWIKGKGLTTYKEYRGIKRSGRQVSLKQSDRKEVYDFLEKLEAVLSKKNLIPFDDYAILINKKIADIPDDFKYDFILIDEAQDLTQSQLSLLRQLNPRSLVVSADMGQRIYNTDFTWKSVGINVVGGRTRSLEEMHRSCLEVVKLAQPLYQNDLKSNNMKSSDDQVELVLPKRRSGILPELHVYEDTSKEFQGIVKTVTAIWRKSAKDITIGVLIRNSKSIYALKSLFPENLPVEKIEKDQGSSLTPGIKLVTMHSAKGLEFDVVIVTRVNEGHLPAISRGLRAEAAEEIVAIDRRLLYVSMTRAKYQLIMTTFGNSISRYITELDESDYKKVKK